MAAPGDKSGVSRSRKGLAGAWALAALLTSSVVSAQQVSGLFEWAADRTDLQTVGVTTGSTRVDDRFGFRQKYQLDLGWQYYANMRLNLGGQFVRVDSTDVGDGTRPDSTQERLQPYLNFRVGSRELSAQFDVIRLQNKSRSGIFTRDDIQDSYTALFSWRPHEYPLVRLRLQRTDFFDADRVTRDTVTEIAELYSQYTWKQKVTLFYRGALEGFEDNLNGNESRRKAHNAEVAYGDAFWHGRARLNAEYNVNLQNTQFTTGGSGEIVTPVVAEAGLSIVTDIPTDVVLDDNPLLIDADVVASAGLNLGTPPPGGNAQPREMGLDFGSPTTIDTLRIWVDRELPALISASFVWEIYTSSDNQTWQFRTVISPAEFGAFEPRFELRFGEITARYVKAVTSPLDPTVPGSDAFPTIFVTELQAFERVPGSSASTETSEQAHRVLTNLRLRLLENQPFFYDFSYVGRKTKNTPLAFNMINGLSYSKQLNPVYGISARVAREDTQDGQNSIVDYPYSASLRASALPTVQHSLVFSGRFQELNDTTQRDNSVFLYNNAQIYRGVRANLNVGTAVTKTSDGRVARNDQILFGSTLRPHRTVNLVLQYQLRTTESAGGGLPTTDRDVAVSRVSVTYIPVRAIYLFGSWRLEQSSGAEDIVTRNYSVSWTPFPGGNLQLTFRYNDTFRTLLNQMFKIFTTRARWNITNRWYLELAWEDARNETDLAVADRDTLRGIMQFRF